MLLSEQNQEISRYNIVKMLMEDDIQVKEFFASVIAARRNDITTDTYKIPEDSP